MPDTIIPVSISIANFSEDVIYRNLIVNTVIGGHHHFSFTWNVGKIKNDQAFQVKIIKDNIGSLVSIQFDKNEFTGIITSIAVEDLNSATQAFVVSGQSLSILIDDVPECASYYKKNLKKIIESTLEGVPDNVLKKDISPANGDEHRYITQYNETDFQFLQRLSARYGEWLYVDGQTLVFGEAGDSGAELKAGSDVKNFVIQGNLQPSKFSYKSYDPFKGEPINKNGGPLDSLSNDYGDAAIGVSKDVYSRSTGRSMHSFNAVTKDMIESIAQLQAEVKTTQSLTVRGESKNPAMKAGNKFKIKTESGSYEYIATSVVHHSNQRGHYENNFNAVAGSSKVPPYTNPNIFRRADTQSAIVKENHDTDGLNRIKVQFPWQKSADTSPWIRVATAHAGGDKGFHFIPEKSEEVIVDFEGGDVDKPFMVASHFHGGAKSSLGSADNDNKVLTTRSGHVFALNDKNGSESIRVADKFGNSIHIDSRSGVMTISTPKEITLASEKINLNAQKEINLTCASKDGGEINIKAKKDVSMESAEESINSLAKKNISQKASQNIEQTASSGFSVSSASVSVDASNELKMHGMKAEIKADTEMAIEGSLKAGLKGGAELELSGGAMATMKAGIVMIN